MVLTLLHMLWLFPFHLMYLLLIVCMGFRSKDQTQSLILNRCSGFVLLKHSLYLTLFVQTPLQKCSQNIEHLLVLFRTLWLYFVWLSISFAVHLYLYVCAVAVTQCQTGSIGLLVWSWFTLSVEFYGLPCWLWVSYRFVFLLFPLKNLLEGGLAAPHKGHAIEDIFSSHAQCSHDRLWTHIDPDPIQVVTDDGWCFTGRKFSHGQAFLNCNMFLFCMCLYAKLIAFYSLVVKRKKIQFKGYLMASNI